MKNFRVDTYKNVSTKDLETTIKKIESKNKKLKKDHQNLLIMRCELAYRYYLK